MSYFQAKIHLIRIWLGSASDTIHGAPSNHKLDLRGFVSGGREGIDGDRKGEGKRKQSEEKVA